MSTAQKESLAAKLAEVRHNVVHWLLIGAAILSGIMELGPWLHWIPGRYGRLANAFFAFVGVVYLIILKVEKRLASPAELTDALADSAKDVASELPALEKDTSNLITQAEQFAPKK